MFCAIISPHPATSSKNLFGAHCLWVKMVISESAQASPASHRFVAGPCRYCDAEEGEYKCNP